MSGRTARRSREEPATNGPARTGLLLGLAAVLVEPAALLLARWTPVSLLQAGFSAPIAAVLGAAALVASRRARLLNERTLGRVGGLRTIRYARWLGLLGLCLAAIVGIALGFYGLLLVFEH